MAINFPDSPSNGDTVTVNNKVWTWNGTTWDVVISSPLATMLVDADSDTKIQVEESVDEDIIRFDTAGSERATIAADGTVTIFESLTVGGGASVTAGASAAAFYGPLTGNVTGDLTGNVTGDLTGNVTGDLTGNVTGDLTGGTITGTLNAPYENWTVSATAATGTVNVDLKSSGAHYFTANATANWTYNFRGDASTTLDSLLAVDESVTVVHAVTNGATPYYATAFQIDGSAVTPKWSGGSAPTSGNASSVDTYLFTIVKTASATFTVLAQQVQFA